MRGLFPPRLPSAIGEGQPRMAEQETVSDLGSQNEISANHAVDVIL